MEAFSADLLGSDNKENQVFGTISKILSGSYHAPISSDSNASYRKIWKWDDRVGAITTIYEANKELFSRHSEVKTGLQSILNSNLSLKKKHVDIYMKISAMLS